MTLLADPRSEFYVDSRITLYYCISPVLRAGWMASKHSTAQLSLWSCGPSYFPWLRRAHRLGWWLWARFGWRRARQWRDGEREWRGDGREETQHTRIIPHSHCSSSQEPGGHRGQVEWQRQFGGRLWPCMFSVEDNTVCSHQAPSPRPCNYDAIYKRDCVLK